MTQGPITTESIIASSSSHPEFQEVAPHASDESTQAPYPHGIPGAIENGQAYYWSRTWQEGELESRGELDAGERQTFESGRDAIRWLLSSDD